jgi:arsenite-transporting ATPase
VALVAAQVAIAAAKQLSSLGQRVLLVGQDPTPAFGLLLGASVGSEPQPIGANLQAVQLQSSVLLERSWEEVKKLEAQYLRSPILKNVFGQELGVLPGMDSALALNAIREYENSGKYDAIIFDGSGDQATLRMLGMPEVFSWYIRRFRKWWKIPTFGNPYRPSFNRLLALSSMCRGVGISFPKNPLSRRIICWTRAKLLLPTRTALLLIW